MKALFISVPQWYPMNPYLAGAVLVGQLHAAGYEASYFDYNIEFFNDILTKEYVLKCIHNAQIQLPQLIKLYESLDNPESNFDNLSKDIKTSLLRLKTIKECFKSYESVIYKIADEIDIAVGIMKDKKRFYEPELLFQAKDIISEALEIISLPYSPSKIQLDNYIADPVMEFSFNDIRNQCSDKNRNMFIEYFEETFHKIPLENCNLIGISVADLSQLIPALTLSKIIKEKTELPVCLGGNYIYKIIREIKQNPEFFKTFCDYISIGDGEIATIDLMDYVSGKISINEVRSLVWLNENGAVIENEIAPLLNMDALAFPNFDDFDFSKYFSPDIVLPVQFSKGCYWGKCKFCDFYTGQQKFDIKSVQHAANEIEFLQNKYRVNHFIFVDEAVPAQFYSDFIDEINHRNINIYFYSFARFDNGFTKQLLNKLHDGGAQFFSWGFEAASPRLLKLMNKGIDPEIRMRILHDCVSIGMWTQCTFLLGYPTETSDELQQTIDIIENRNLINSCTPSNFVLKKNAILKNEADKVGITDFKSNGDFHISYSYQSSGTSMQQVKQNRMQFEHRFLSKTADSLWSLGFTDTDHLLLYLSKYGRDFVRDYRLKYKKTNK